MPYIGNQHNVGDHVNNFKVLDDISSYTATFDGSATSVVSTSAETIRIPEHRFIQGQRVTYNNGGGSNIGGLTSGTAYYVSFDSANTIKLATSLANANSNNVINLSTVGGGTSHTLNAAFDGINTKFKLTFGSGNSARLNNATQINVAINNVIQRPNLDANNFTDGFALADNHKIVFKTAPTSQDIFWGSIISNTIENFDLRDNEVDNFTGNGSATEFNLSTIPANNESVIVTIDGVLQHPSDKNTSRAYTLLSNIIQFTAAPALNAEIQVRHIGFAGASTNDVSGFYGRTGNVTLTANDHITTGDITSRNINASGIITAASANFGGNVSIGGTLTYEDVANIDSVGIITARDGIFIPDNKKLSIGNAAGNTGDLQLFHTTSHSIIRDYGTGSLLIQGSGVFIQNSNGGTNVASFLGNTGVSIPLDLDVDGHTNLDNVSIAGVTTTSDMVKIISDRNALSDPSVADNYHLHLRNPNNDLNETVGIAFGLSTGGDIGAAITHEREGSTSFGNLRFYTKESNSAASMLERMRITKDGKVGIGTDDPQTSLHLYGGASGFRLERETSNPGYFNTSISHGTPVGATNYGSAYFTLSQTTGDYVWRSSTNERMRLKGNGRLGIGTDNPQKTLHVKSGAGSGYNSTYNGRTTAIIDGDSVSGTVLSILAKSSGYSGIFFGDESSEASGQIQYIHSSNSFKFNTSGGTSNLVLDGGYVGIGTDTPGAPLNVRSSANTLGILSSTDSGANLDLFDDDTQSRIRTVDGKLHLYADFGNNVSDSAIRFFVDGNNEKVRITPDGNVGIGSENPSYKLSIVSGSNLGISLINNQSFGTAGVYFEGGRNAGTGIVGELQFYNRRTITTSNLKVNGDGDFNFEGSNTNSKVGINSISPEKQLVVRTGSGSDSGILVKPNINYAANQDRAYLIVGTDDWGTGSSWKLAGFQHRIKSNSTGTARVTIDTSGGEAFCVENGGHVGIGTNDPVRPLHIHAADCRIRLEDAGVATDVELQNTSGDAVLTTNGASNVRLQTDNTERLRIDANGLMGLGVTPTSHVNTTAFHIHDDYNSAGVPRIRLTNESTGSTSADGYEIVLNGTDMDAVHRQRENADIYFMTNNSERFRITADGDIYTSGSAVRDDARLTVEKNKVGVSTAIHLHNSNGSGTASKISCSKAIIISADVEDNTGTDRSFIAFETDNSEKLRIDSSGYVTKPNNAMFKAVMSASRAQSSSGWVKIQFDDDSTTSKGCFDVGNNFNTSNNRFTAPVTGYYHFGCNQRFDSINGNYVRLVFYKNGSAGDGYPHGHAIYRDNDGFAYVSLTITGLIQLNANDYVEAWAYSHTDTSWTLQRESNFYGFLVG